MKTIKDYANKDYDYISYRVTAPEWRGEDVTASNLCNTSEFAGCFALKNGEIIPLDGDSYDLEEEVVYFEEWEKEDEGIKHGATVVCPVVWLTGSN